MCRRTPPIHWLSLHFLSCSANPALNGILVQLSLPRHISESQVLAHIDPAKDVDGFHPVNVGRMLLGEPCFLPCTPHGIVAMLQRSGVATAGAEVVMVGRSNIVGKPVAALLMQKGLNFFIRLVYNPMIFL